MKTLFPLFTAIGAGIGTGISIWLGAPQVVVGLAAAGGAATPALFGMWSAAKLPAARNPETIRTRAAPVIWDSLPAPVLLVDRSARIVGLNEAARALFGDISLDEPLVTAIRSPDLIDSVEDTLTDDAPRDLRFSQVQGRSRRSLNARIRRLDSTEEAHADDPIRRRAPAALILVEDHTKMQQVEEMRHDFIANASHELKTPLASIIGFIETLQGPAKDDAAARERFLGIMATQADRMKRLVEDLLSLNRIEMNTHVAPTGRVDLGALAQETAAALAPVADAGDAKIILETAKSGPVVNGDRDQLAQLLTNFIDNAIKYGGQGVTVTVAMAPPAPEWPGKVGIRVRDTGPGIPREHLPRLTERFYRVSASHSRSVGGTGLGLAIAKHIAQRHKGEISVRSKTGEGSEFTLWLPGPVAAES